MQPVFQNCELLMLDAKHWRQAHDSAQDALTTMDGEFCFLCCYCADCCIFCSECCCVSQTVVKLPRSKSRRWRGRFPPSRLLWLPKRRSFTTSTKSSFAYARPKRRS